MVSEIFNEDCMVGMARYPDKFFDLAVVDPPYGLGDEKLTQGGTWASKYKKGDAAWDVKPNSSYRDWETSLYKHLFPIRGYHYYSVRSPFYPSFNATILARNWLYIYSHYRDWETDRKSTRLNSSHSAKSRMPSSA